MRRRSGSCSVASKRLFGSADPMLLVFALVASVALAACSDGSAVEGTSATVGSTAPSEHVTLPVFDGEPPVPVDQSSALPRLPDGRVIHVADDGDDAADGEVAPVASIARALEIADDGDVVQLAPGRYHEEVVVRSAIALVGDPADPGSVVLDGASRATEWRPTAAGWAMRWDLDMEHAEGAPVHPARPVAGFPEMVFVDGRPLEQVQFVDDLRPGTFTVDLQQRLLVMSDDPDGHEVMVSDLEVGIDLTSADSARVSGLTVQRYATPTSRLAAVRAYADDIVIDHVVARDNAAMGLSVIGARAQLDTVTAEGNGYIGIHAHESEDLTVTGARVSSNNAEGFDPVHSGAGVKVTETAGFTLADSVVEDNDGPGVWTDLGTSDVAVRSSSIVGNVGSGVLIELSGQAVLVDDTVSGTRDSLETLGRVQGAGVWVLESNDVSIWNLTVSGNAREVWLQDGPRIDPNGDDAVAWDLGGVQIANTVIGPTAGRLPLLAAEDWTHERSADDFGIELVGDVFVRSDPSVPLMSWDRWPELPTVAGTIAEVEGITGSVDPAVEAPSSDVRLLGVDPPADVATLLGVPPGVDVPRGALSTTGRGP